MKLCSKCLEWLPFEAFAKNRSRPDGLQNCCRTCQRAYVRDHYLRNVAYYLAKAKRSNRKRVEVIRRALQELKAVPCADCGGVFPGCAMDFDHVRGVKAFNVGEAVRRSKTALLREAAKCDIVCSNCHRRRTYLRMIGERP